MPSVCAVSTIRARRAGSRARAGDPTPDRLAYSRMREAEFRPDTEGLGSLLALIPEFLMVVGRDGRLLYINRVEPGYDLDAVTGRQAAEFILPEFRDRFDATVRSVLASGEPAEYDSRAFQADGSPSWYRSRILPVRAADGEPIAVMLIATNITELKRREEENARLRQLLPVCAWCDRIRDDAGEWKTITEYLGKEHGVSVTHGICPACQQRQMGQAGNP